MDLKQSARRGHAAWHAGDAAEEQVAREYTRRGMHVSARRWRTRNGEIDIIGQVGGALVFVEVKKSRSHDSALWRVTPRQIARIFAAAGDYLAAQGLPFATPMRFDLALVDGVGRIEIMENALFA
jgi:putative endonuclease